MDVAGWRVSGTIDLLEPGTIYDYKVSSVWSVVFGPKPEWVQQLNLYRLLHGEPYPETLKVVVIARDWQMSKAAAKPDYPQLPIAVINIPVWEMNEAMTYLHERVALHQKSVDLDDYSLPYCTPEERWARPSTWAVTRPGRVSALRVLSSKQEAEQWIGDKDGLSVEERPGKSVRCEDYCLVKKFCNQYMEGDI